MTYISVELVGCAGSVYAISVNLFCIFATKSEIGEARAYNDAGIKYHGAVRFFEFLHFNKTHPKANSFAFFAIVDYNRCGLYGSFG